MVSQKAGGSLRWPKSCDTTAHGGAPLYGWKQTAQDAGLANLKLWEQVVGGGFGSVQWPWLPVCRRVGSLLISATIGVYSAFCSLDGRVKC